MCEKCVKETALDISSAIAKMLKAQGEREAGIKKAFASHNAINDSLGKINCCSKSKGGVFKILVEGNSLKCICTSCYRVSAFHIPFIMNGAFDGELMRQG